MRNKIIFKSDIDRFFLNLFLISIFFFKIPSFYVIPFIQNPFITTQSIARVFIPVVFIYYIVRSYLNNKIIVDKKNNKLIFLITLLFALQSLSVISVINIDSYLLRYKDIILSILSFFLFYYYRKNAYKIFLVIFLSILFNAFYQFIMIFSTDFFRNYITQFIYEKQLINVLNNLSRGRTFTDTYDEAFVPLLFIVSPQILGKQIYSYILYVVISIFSLLSNWRIRIVMLMMATFGTLVIFKHKIKRLSYLIIILFISIMLSHIFLTQTFGFSFLDRFSFQSKSDIFSIDYRFSQIVNSIEQGSSGILGVGLGNYYDNLSGSEKPFYSTSVYSPQYELGRLASEYSHNIFGLMVAESGFFGFLVFLIIILLIIKNDMLILTGNNLQKKALVMCFWTLFLYGFFNPPIPGTYQFLFWGLRGLLL